MDTLLGPAELSRWCDGDRPPVVLDVRWRLGGPPAWNDYLGGHLPGAVFVDLDRDLSGLPGSSGRHPLPDPARLQESFDLWGLRADRPVVVYDQADSTSAARAWWVLRWAGVDRVHVLDGGVDGWVAAGLPLAAGTGTERNGTALPAHPSDTDEMDSSRDRCGPLETAGAGLRCLVRPGGMPVLDAAAAARTARDGALLDARSPERYRGEVEPVDPVAGHVPGAVSAPTAANVGADGRFLPAARLRERFAALGVTGGTPVGVYCGSGVTAAHEVLALDLAGVPAALYVGSWSEWVADPTRPVATGPDPGRA